MNILAYTLIAISLLVTTFIVKKSNKVRFFWFWVVLLTGTFGSIWLLLFTGYGINVLFDYNVWTIQNVIAVNYSGNQGAMVFVLGMLSAAWVALLFFKQNFKWISYLYLLMSSLVVVALSVSDISVDNEKHEYTMTIPIHSVLDKDENRSLIEANKLPITEVFSKCSESLLFRSGDYRGMFVCLKGDKSGEVKDINYKAWSNPITISTANKVHIKLDKNEYKLKIFSGKPLTMEPSAYEPFVIGYIEQHMSFLSKMKDEKLSKKWDSLKNDK